jgi:hypothetical protein
MKKKTTIVNQPDKTETSKPESPVHPSLFQKLYYNHSYCDHSHGRVNKFPFGSLHGPGAF